MVDNITTQYTLTPSSSSSLPGPGEMALLQLNNTVFTELVLDARYSLSVVACSNFSCKQSTSVTLSELVCFLLIFRLSRERERKREEREKGERGEGEGGRERKGEKGRERERERKREGEKGEREEGRERERGRRGEGEGEKEERRENVRRDGN